MRRSTACNQVLALVMIHLFSRAVSEDGQLVMLAGRSKLKVHMAQMLPSQLDDNADTMQFDLRY